MPGQTPNLNLYKKNPLTDGEDTFNIETMLNNNWDKLDAAVDGKVDKAAGKGLSTNDYTTEAKSKLEGATSAATPTRIILRDSAGRAKVASPAAADDIARKDTVDAHASSTSGVHGATSAATALMIVQRDSAGRAKVAAPVAADDIARKDTVDTAVQPLQADLANAAPVSISLLPGQQVVTVPRDTPLNVLNIKGRTLINLLGRSGNCESISRQSASGATIVTDTSTFTSGSASTKITLTTTAGYFYPANMIYPNLDEYYLGIGEVKTNAANIMFHFNSLGITATTQKRFDVSTTSSYKNAVQLVKITAVQTPGSSSIEPCLYITGSSNNVTNADNLRFYKVSAAEAANIMLMSSADQIAASYPYVDDVKNVNGVYIKQFGNNMLPPISQWANGRPDGQYKASSISVISPDEVQITVGSGVSSMLSTLVELLPNTTYSVSGILSSVYVYELGVYGSFVANLTSGKSFTTTSATKYVIGAYKTGAQSSPFTIKNVMLNLGSSALTYEQQNEQYVFYPDANLAASLDGSVYDELYTDSNGQARVTRRFRSMDLTGDLAWEYGDTKTGSKQVRLPVSNQIIDSERVVKYDGKIIIHVYPYSAGDQSFMTQGADNKLYLSIPGADSGWGDNYTPTADEIKAYFYGWKMGVWDNPSTAYNGSGTKAWTVRRDGWYYNQTSTLPTIPSKSVEPSTTWQNYRFQYQLAVPTDEPVRSEGAILLSGGENRIEVGCGAIVREQALYGANDTGSWFINVDHPANFMGLNSTKLKYRTKSILGVYRDRIRDYVWEIDRAGTDTYGRERLVMQGGKSPDLSAVYEVTYTALDTYQIGIAPSLISAQYAPNAREVTDGLVKASQQLMGRVSVLENGTAQAKQPQWIAPTLINGWVNYDGGTPPAGYMLDSSGYVHLRGLIKNGATAGGTILFVLPKGYRVATQLNVPIVCSAGLISQLTIDSTGVVRIGMPASGVWTSLDSVTFLLGQ
ncbi:hypothetical protein [Paenibacillus humicus]|uniref:hypothetical protein n=1 Tax=Paenibacillus humicus TaxID=412861 RepID=UPI003F1631E9